MIPTAPRTFDYMSYGTDTFQPYAKSLKIHIKVPDIKLETFVGLVQKKDVTINI